MKQKQKKMVETRIAWYGVFHLVKDIDRSASPLGDNTVFETEKNWLG